MLQACLKSMISRFRGTSNFSTAAASSVGPKMKPTAASALELSPEFKARYDEILMIKLTSD